ncbi:hypothetical protein FZI91_03140 [Mycobacterium sp. CBMA271]|uniref:hypothetical protein n=1 Tax=unclassified Mycobacteroides TaxID=2618759 RepID=UPI0012DCBD2F|nr:MULTISPECIES: hypothetical protein [unclassified Mycobacteroides]MUM16354.1 hypothetical protein [Mycobacteroides sp. CBMA 326]MUM20702.1 hypothetical protein [Mycobacteroides sp. CBMA 271]
MPQKFEFDPYELHDHAGQIESAATGLREAHDAAHLALSQSARGLGGGAAAAALAGRLSDWERETAQMDTEQVEHAQNHRGSLAKYLEQEGKNATNLNHAVR